MTLINWADKVVNPSSALSPYDPLTAEQINSLKNAINNLDINGTKQGFIDYNNSSTDVTLINLIANQWVDVPNNGLGAYSNDLYKPVDVTELLDTSTGYIDATELSLGDSLLIRNDYTVYPQIDKSSLSFRYVLGSGLQEYSQEKKIPRLDEGAGVGYRQAILTDYIYMGDDNTRNNPIKLQVKLSVNGTLYNAGLSIQVIKR